MVSNGNKYVDICRGNIFRTSLRKEGRGVKKHEHRWIFRKWCNACECGKMLIKTYVKSGKRSDDVRLSTNARTLEITLKNNYLYLK